MKTIKNLITSICLLLLLSTNTYAQETETVTLITNAKIFDGSDKLIEGKDVLIQGNKIVEIAAGIVVTQDTNSTIIDAGGRTLTPGFIAMHEHLMLQMSAPELLTNDTRYFAYRATETVHTYLMNGYTTTRDVSGNTFALKKAIDQGHILGPRIYPSGPMISQTGGHSDHRMPSMSSQLVGGIWDPLTRYGDMAVVDGVPEMLKAVRENLREGASQIKLALGGGTGSYSDPLEVVEFLPEEVKAAVQAAEDFGTYVTVHCYNNEGVRRAIDNGVRCVEHGQLMDEATLKLMKDKDIWLSPQVIVFTFIPKGYTEDQANKHRQAYAGIDNMFTIAKKIGFDKIVFGSDIITDPDMIVRMNEEFKHRSKWFSNVEILRQATSKGGELLAMSGPKNPYPSKLGVIEVGAYADVLLINGNPLDDISILTNPSENLALIMKDGKVYKNTIN